MNKKFYVFLLQLSVLLNICAQKPILHGEMQYIIKTDSILCLGKEDEEWYKMKENAIISVYNQNMISGTLSIPGSIIEGGKTYDVVIGEGAFENIPRFEHLVINDGVKSIKTNAFKNCKLLKSVSIPSTVTEIDPTAFSYCKSLERITIDYRNNVYCSPDGTNSIISNGVLVKGCKSSVIPLGTHTIGVRAFESCSDMQTIVIPEGVTTIESCAFENCKQLQQIVLPSTLKRIEGGAFRNCISLKSIFIPASVESIISPFRGCISLDTIIVSKDNKSYDSREGCNAIIDTSSGELIAGCRKTIIPNGVKSLKTSFMEIPIQTICIPKSVEEIDAWAFYGCQHITTIDVDVNNPVYDSKEGSNLIIEKQTGTLVIGCLTTVFSSGIKKIADYAFAGRIMQRELQIPYGIEYIGREAFSQCVGLTDIIIPYSIYEIKEYAFEGCVTLENVTLNADINEIKRSTFRGCTRLKSINVPLSVKIIGSNAFAGCHSLTDTNLGVNVVIIEKGAYNGCPCEQLILNSFSSRSQH